MVKYSEGADLLIHEACNKDWLDALIVKFPEQTVGLSNPAEYHTTTLEAACIRGMNEIYTGKITMARDLMEFDPE